MRHARTTVTTLAAGVLVSGALLTGTVAPAHADPAPPTLEQCSATTLLSPERPRPSGIPVLPASPGTLQSGLTGCPSAPQFLAGSAVSVTFYVFAADFGANPTAATGDLTFYDVDPVGAATLLGTAELATTVEDERLAAATLVLPEGLAAGHDVAATYAGDAQFTAHEPRYARTAVITGSDPAAQYTERLYLDVLRRHADAAGETYWRGVVASGRSGDAAYAFALSPARLALEVRDAYPRLLSRDVDPSGLAYYTGLLGRGFTVQDLELTLFLSPEAAAQEVNTDTGFVDRAYYRLLQRAPDAGGEAYWVDQLHRGVSRGSVAAAFVGSDEHAARDLDALYGELLDRPVDPAGARYWAAAMRAGYRYELVTYSVLTGGEYRAHVPEA